MSDIKLVDPSMDYFDSFLEGLEEGFPKIWGDRAAPYPPEKIKEIKDNPKAYIQEANQFKGRIYVAPNGKELIHNKKILWIVDSNKYIGTMALVPESHGEYKEFAGHVGYAIRPSKRKMGYATKGIFLIKEYIKKHYPTLSEFLIVCSVKNTISEKVILKSGGEYIKTTDPGNGFNHCKHYRFKI